MDRRFAITHIGWLSLRMMVFERGPSDRPQASGTAVNHYAGIDVSLKESSVCVVDTTGKVIREEKVASEPEALVGNFDDLDAGVSRWA